MFGRGDNLTFKKIIMCIYYIPCHSLYVTLSDNVQECDM